MSNNLRVLNITRGYHMKYKHALRAIDQCAVTWVEEGATVRDLTLSESIAARNHQAKLREPLDYTELFGLRFEDPANAAEGKRERNMLMWAACKFASDHIAASA